MLLSVDDCPSVSDSEPRRPTAQHQTLWLLAMKTVVRVREVQVGKIDQP